MSEGGSSEGLVVLLMLKLRRHAVTFILTLKCVLIDSAFSKPGQAPGTRQQLPASPDYLSSSPLVLLMTRAPAHSSPASPLQPSQPSQAQSADPLIPDTYNPQTAAAAGPAVMRTRFLLEICYLLFFELLLVQAENSAFEFGIRKISS